MVTTIPLWKMIMETKGKVVGLFILAMIPVLTAGGIGVFLDGLQNGKNGSAALGLLGALFFGAAVVLFIPQRKYIAGKSFVAYRSKQLLAQKSVKYGYWIVALFAIVFLLLDPSRIVLVGASTITAFAGFYALSKSLKFHEDVDYSANEYLASSLGINTGEKALASYQNFDADNIQRGSNAFVATATQLVVATFNGEYWEKLSRPLNQITRIGIIGDEDNSHCVKLIFNDGSGTLLRIGLHEKLTSSPSLVIKRLLEVIDANLLGADAAPKAPQRRRVVLTDDTTPSQTSTLEPETSTAARDMELAPAPSSDAKNAEVARSGRKLEL
ncbi:hypothetical protein [Pseudomonas batumici]|uniref:hypothetical protein n=1 Tax=Pseudomonas batumici TaxID=226910 RepID=UPI00058A2BE2|nr:hypothetical protein [Pseudomonas batumici]